MQRQAFEQSIKSGQSGKKKLQELRFGDLTEVDEVDINLEDEDKTVASNEQTDRVTMLKEELEMLKNQIKAVQDELNFQKKEELNQHKTIVDVKRDINLIITYVKKMQVKNKIETQMQRKAKKELPKDLRVNSGNPLKKKTGGITPIPDLIIQEDIDQIQEEIKDLEAKIEHKEAILKIDRYFSCFFSRLMKFNIKIEKNMTGR